MIKRQQGTPVLNIWCAACSSGQEPYSIAILIREHFPSLAKENVKLIASDLSTKVLTRARQGIYSDFEISRGLPESLRDKYFQKQTNEWQLHPEIRQMVDFRHLNLLESWSDLPVMDIIFMRNVLLYFDTEMKKAILTKIPGLLKSNGYLFMGGGETTINLIDSFARVQLDKAICYQPQ
jgi:chemotaxis protein methyltransferase CheR